MSQLSDAIQEMRNMREAYNALAGAAEAYNEGKDALATAITAKGQTTSASDSLATMAGKISLIQQESYTINGGEMYAKQQFGSLTTPNYWNLYEVMASLLSDGRFVNYGGILLAEYYKGYATIALSGAGAGGGYVTSDGQYYTEDITHTWNDDADGKGNRWIAYLFASEGHGFTISDTNTCPRSIHIGRHVGTIESLVNGRISEIVVTDGNTLDDFKTSTHSQNWAQKVVLRNLDHVTGCLLNNVATSIYIKANIITGVDFYTTPRYTALGNIYSAILEANTIESVAGSNEGGIIPAENLAVAIISAETIKTNGVYGVFRAHDGVSHLTCCAVYNIEELSGFIVVANNLNFATLMPDFKKIYFGYKTNDKTRTVAPGSNPIVEDIELQDGWCKPLNLANGYPSLTEANMYAHILQRLKQDEEDCGDGVTITLGATNLAKLTSQESIDLLDTLTNTYGYTFA